MMYQLYQAQADLLLPLRQFARFGACVTRLADCGACTPPLLRQIAAGLTIFAEAGLTHHRPSFGIDLVTVDG
jgi:poly(3-hydroxybutyrate) depolymerase